MNEILKYHILPMRSELLLDDIFNIIINDLNLCCENNKYDNNTDEQLEFILKTPNLHLLLNKEKYKTKKLIKKLIEKRYLILLYSNFYKKLAFSTHKNQIFFKYDLIPDTLFFNKFMVLFTYKLKNSKFGKFINKINFSFFQISKIIVISFDLIY